MEERGFVETPHHIWDGNGGGFPHGKGTGCKGVGMSSLYGNFVWGERLGVGVPGLCVCMCLCVCVAPHLRYSGTVGSPSFFLLENGPIGLWHPAREY